MIEIYHIVDSSNGLGYVGMTSRGAYGNGILISRVKKKRPSEISAPMILTATESKLTADYLERFFIKVIGTVYPDGYNLALGGDGGAIQTLEMKARLSKTLRAGYAAHPDRRARISAKLKGRQSPNKGKRLPDEWRAKIAESGKGRIVSEEARQKSSALQKGRPKSAESRLRMSIAAKARVATTEGLMQMRKASEAAWRSK